MLVFFFTPPGFIYICIPLYRLTFVLPIHYFFYRQCWKLIIRIVEYIELNVGKYSGIIIIHGGWIFKVFVDSFFPRIYILHKVNVIKVIFLFKTETRRIHEITSSLINKKPSIHDNLLHSIVTWFDKIYTHMHNSMNEKCLRIFY